ncbi:MAG: hypothetical protein AB4290_14490, partial [Spirulina sp.]
MKYVVYRYVLSVWVMTYNRSSRVYRVASKREAILRSLPYSLFSLLLGWWGIPWGPIRTIQALIVNFTGGEIILTSEQQNQMYPNLKRIKAAIKTLYKHFSRQTLHGFSHSILPDDLAIARKDDPIMVAHRLASAIVRHLHLPNGSILVTYKNNLDVPGRVELTPRNEYFIELHSRYKENTHDIAAILAHEITHIFLYRAGLWLNDSLDNEILTDTTSIYLGIGWLGLNAYRLTTKKKNNNSGQRYIQYQEERLGYITPEEFAYVLGKRGILHQETMNGVITSPFAKGALKRGIRSAKLDYRRPPMKNCDLIRRILYQRRQRKIIDLAHSGKRQGLSHLSDGYQFEV